MKNKLLLFSVAILAFLNSFAQQYNPTNPSAVRISVIVNGVPRWITVADLTKLKEPTIAVGTTGQYFRGDKSWQNLNSASVGLSNVDNTSDLNKPISTIQQTALNLKQNLLTGGFKLFTLNGQDVNYNSTITVSGSYINPFAFNPKTDNTAYGNANVTGNGTTNDAPALQNAINNAKTAGRDVVQLPIGTYVIDNQIAMPSGITLMGTGNGTILKYTSAYAGTDPMFIEYGESNITIKNLTIAGNAKKIDAIFQLNCYPNQANDIKFEDVKFFNVWAHCISSQSSGASWANDRITITDLVAENIGDPSNMNQFTDNDATKSNVINLEGGSRVIIDRFYVNNASGRFIYGYGYTDTGEVPKDFLNYNITNGFAQNCFMIVEINGNQLGRGIKIDNVNFKYAKRNGGFLISIDGAQHTITNSTFLSTDRSVFEVTGTPGSKMSGNTVQILPTTSTSGGIAPTELVGNIAFVEGYGFEYDISDNKLFYPVGRTGANSFTPTDFRGIKIVSRTTDPTYQPLSYDGISDFAGYWNIIGNTISGTTDRVIDATVEKIRKVKFQSNVVRSRNQTGAPFPIFGYNWDIGWNTLDFEGSSGTQPAFSVSGSQADNTLSFVHDNDIFNANFGTITDQTKLKQDNNRVITTDANQSVYVIPATNAYKPVAVPYTVFVDDVDVTVTSGSGNITLPSASSNAGKEYFIKNATGSSITLATTSSQTIDGVTTQILPTLSYTRVYSNGTNWVVKDTKFPVLGGYASASGTVAATDNVLTAINKLNGNDLLKAPISNATLTGNTTIANYRVTALNTAPASATATGVLGEIRWTNGFLYLCVATNTWQRVALATW